MMLSEQDVCAGYIRQQTDDGDKQHPIRFDRRRIQDPVICLIKYVQRHQDQENAVEQRHKNLDPVEPVGLSGSRAPGGKVHRE